MKFLAKSILTSLIGIGRFANVALPVFFALSLDLRPLRGLRSYQGDGVIAKAVLVGASFCVGTVTL